MTTTRRHEVDDRHLDLMLAEQLGDARAPDVSAAVAGRLAEARAARVRGHRTLLQAVCVLLGLAVVVGIAVLSGDGTAIDTATDTAARSATQQPRLGPVVTVASLEQIEALPVDTDNVRLRLYTADAVRALTRLRTLRRLDASFDAEPSFRPRAIERPAFFPDAARWLGMLTSLEELDISGHAPIRGLEQFATLKRLRSLRIYYAFLDPKGLAVLRQLPKLEHFHLEASLRIEPDEPLIDLRDPQLGFVAFLEKGQLRRLTITACIIDAKGIDAVAKNPLEQLCLRGLSRRQRVGRHREALEASAYEAVGRITTLRELTLNDSVTAALRRSLASMPDLVALDLGATDGLTGAEAGRDLAAIPNLRVLRLEGGDIDAPALIAMAAAPHVVELELGGYERLTGDVLAAVAKMPALRDLVMTNPANGLTDADFEVLSDTRLESYSMGYTQTLSDVGTACLPRSLRRLDVHETDFGPLALARFEQLEELRLTIFPGEIRQLFEELAASAMRDTLRTLTLDGLLGQFGDPDPLLALPALRRLDLSECTGELAPELHAKLRARGVEVQLPRRRKPEQIEVIESVEVEKPDPDKGPGGGR